MPEFWTCWYELDLVLSGLFVVQAWLNLGLVRLSVMLVSIVYCPVEGLVPLSLVYSDVLLGRFNYG
jgi:hypothetical protein